MTLKLFRAVWFLSVLVVLANLLYVYASLPDLVIVQEDDPVSVNREWLFYVLMAAIVMVNVLVYFVRMMYLDAEDLRAWFHGFIITINIFLIISMHALNVYNGREIFDHSRVEFFITGSLGLIILWAAFWPLYLLFQKFVVKQAVS